MVIFLICSLHRSPCCKPKRQSIVDIQYFLRKQCAKGIPEQNHVTGISKAELLPNGKALKVETDYATSNPIEKRSRTGTGSNEHLVALRMSHASRSLKPWSGDRGNRNVP